MNLETQPLSKTTNAYSFGLYQNTGFQSRIGTCSKGSIIGVDCRIAETIDVTYSTKPNILF